MLSQKDNEALVRVGAGTVMGEYFRLYWIPFLPSADLTADGKPKRVRLLGEDLVAFRGSDGVVGLLDAFCPHRRAPLAYGRNEDCGLRCVYHGWKFDVEGKVVDLPAEPNKAVMRNLRAKAYPCRERNGVIWTYMGTQTETLPPLPNMEWNMVPPEQAVITYHVQPINWLQGLEGDLDSAHAPILHGRIDSRGSMSNLRGGEDLAPVFEVVRQPFGLSIGATRQQRNGKVYVRVNQFVLPFFTFVGPQATFPELTGHAWVPMDDEHVLIIMFSYHPSEPLHPKTVQIYAEGYKGRETGHVSNNALLKEDDPSKPYAGYWTKYTRENDFQFNYEEQQTTWFSGLPGLWVQDVACQGGAGPIADRSQEHLVSSDRGIVLTRRLLLEEARAHAASPIQPAVYDDPDIPMIRPLSLTLDEGDDWKASKDTHMRARLGADFGYVP